MSRRPKKEIDMDEHIRALRMRLLSTHFDEANRERVTEWLVANENRRAVVLVGAGFSRNAVDRRSGGFASRSVPLWPELVAQLAIELGVARTQYDPLTMAEMYSESLGPGRLRDTLLAALPDEHLEPGPAHAALAKYDFEAILTTNLLDTLLDDHHVKCYGNRPTRRVVHDSELSSSLGPHRQRRDLIYAHGHRSQFASWVITRSQYEDIPNSRPVILTRMRQLFAQHPLLIIGFGLGDPDFHFIYRQLTGEMGGHQPLSLAIQMEPARPAEARHWDSLGIRIATPKEHRELLSDAQRASQFFEWLFAHIPTSWSPDDGALIDYAREPDGLPDRVRRFAELLPSVVSAGATYREKRAMEFRAWRKILDSILTRDDEAAAKTRAREWGRFEEDQRRGRGEEVASSIRGIDTDPSPSEQLGAPQDLKMLPKWNVFRRNNPETWRLEGILANSVATRRALFDHFQLALSRDLFRTSDAESDFTPWIPLTVAVAFSAELGSAGLTELIAQCIRECDRYADAEWAELIVDYAKERAFAVPADAHSDDAGSRGVREAMAGQVALLDANALEGRRCYAVAAEMAQREGRDFDEWAWRRGEGHSIGVLRSRARLRGPEKPSPPEAELEAAAEANSTRVRVLESGEIVRSWLDDARQRIERLVTEVADRREDAADRRAHGGTSFTYSSRAYSAWRSFRDLERIGAPPHVLREYLQPVVQNAKGAVAEDFRWRLRLGMDKGAKWLGRTLDEPSATIESQRERDAALVAIFWETATTSTEQLARLDAVGAITQAFGKSDVARLLPWVRALRNRVGSEASTDSSHRFLFREFPRALAACASVGPAEETLDVFKSWWAHEKQIDRDGLADVSHRFPWYRWVQESPAQVVEWLDWACTWSHAEAPTASARLVFAMNEALVRLARGKIKLTDGLDAKVRSVAQRVHGLSVESNGLREQWRRAAYLLERQIEHVVRTSREARALLDRWMVPGLRPDERDGRELNWSIIADAIDLESRASVHDSIVDALRVQWASYHNTEAHRADIRFYELNPRHATPVARFLACCLRHGDASSRSEVARWACVLAEAAPDVLDCFAPTCSRDYFGEAWSSFVYLVSQASLGLDTGRARRRDGDDRSGVPTEKQLGAVDLWAALVRARARPDMTADERLVDDRLRPIALALVDDDRALVANHAAYAIVAAAERETNGDDVLALETALRRIAVDTRVSVRAAIAYAGGRLSKKAANERIRALVVELGATVASDPNARINLQARQGDWEGAATADDDD